MKKDNLALEKLSSPLMLLLAQLLILLPTKSGNRMGSKNISNNILPMVMPVIFSSLTRIFFTGFILGVVPGFGGSLFGKVLPQYLLR